MNPARPLLDCSESEYDVARIQGDLEPGSIEVSGLTLESNNLHSSVVKLDAAVKAQQETDIW